MRNILFIIICMLFGHTANAQTDGSFSKLSPYVRRVVMQNKDTRANTNASITAFVKTFSCGDESLRSLGCRVLARMGDVYVAEIPTDAITMLASRKDVVRIEASRSCAVQLDTTGLCTDYARVHAGSAVHRAFTGQGVVMGIMDVGFDLTNPNFYSRDMSDYRIRRFWDMLSADKDPSFVVGREYVGSEAILNLRHSADNLFISHGTHTLGIAAGSGYDSDYVGVAPESDICLVNNAVVEDSVLIPEEDEGKYTLATDALGFKYIFDYASSQGKPCVISFSEGSRQAFGEDNMLFHEALQSLVGPGRILVASAGNDGGMDNTMTKDASDMHCGSFVYSPYKQAYFALKSSADFNIVIKSYGGSEPDKYNISSQYIIPDENGEYKVEFNTDFATYKITVMKYVSAFDPEETVYDMLIEGDDLIGARVPVSVELFGKGAEVQMYAYNCVFMNNNLDTELCDGSSSRTILTPGSAPAVICVGASSYRGGFVNYKGEYKSWNNGADGVIAPYSSKGPTFDGRIKPDVVAPGTNVISSYSSYYIEACPDAFDTQSDVSRYDYNGRTYSWNANTGTSMSSPVVGGIIALWLEADPHLSPDDIRDVFSASCIRRDSALEYPNNIWGYGEINAYQGLCHILGIDGIEGIESEARDYHVVPVEGGFDILLNKECESEILVDVFTVSGSLYKSAYIKPASTRNRIMAASGVYALRLSFGKGEYQSLLVRVD